MDIELTNLSGLPVFFNINYIVSYRQCEEFTEILVSGGKVYRVQENASDIYTEKTAKFEILQQISLVE
jgi:uncharacterized protein YlzI (FlbEa/FlbD family)